MAKKLRVKGTVRAAMDDLDELRRLAQDDGIVIAVSQVLCCGGRTKTYHFMFNDCDGQRLLDYWPGTGRYRKPKGDSGTVKSCWDALEEAISD